MAFLCLRYVELNTKLQASFRRYNSAIPSYLRERPHHIIKHSMDRLSLAESIPSSNVTVIDMENGEFLVKSQSSLEEKKMYKVMFGTKQPSCECFDWERQRLPYKHFFTVFQHVPSWSFDRLPRLPSRWIGHVARQEASIAKTAMHWTPEGKRKRGRPKITWRRTVEKEIKEMGKTWEGIKFMARDRQMWREHVAALHAC